MRMQTKIAFTLIELAIAMAIFAVLMVGTLEVLTGSTALSGDVSTRSNLRIEAQNIVMKLTETLSDATFETYNTNAAGDENVGFTRITYREMRSLFNVNGRVTWDPPVGDPASLVSFEDLQATYPKIADRFPNPKQDDGSPTPDNVLNIIEGTLGKDTLGNDIVLDKDALSGVFFVVNKTRKVLFIGVALEDTYNGQDFTEEFLVFTPLRNFDG